MPSFMRRSRRRWTSTVVVDGAFLHVGVEGVEVDPADAGFTGSVFDLDEFGVGEFVLEVDLVAHDDDFLGHGRVVGACGDAFEPDDGVFFAADELDDLLKLHVHDIDHFAVFALGDADDAVVDLEFALAVGGATDDEALDLGRAVVHAEEGADAEEALIHADLEVIHFGLAEVFRVGVVDAGERGEEVVRHVLVVVFFKAFEVAVVTLEDAFFRGFLGCFSGSGCLFGLRLRGFFGRIIGCFSRCGRVGVSLPGGWIGFGGGGFFAAFRELLSFFLLFRLLAEVFLEEVSFDDVCPDLIGLGLVCGPVGLFPADFYGAVGVEGEFVLVEENFDFCDPFTDAVLVEFIDLLCGGNFLGEDLVVEFGAVFFDEAIDILLGEVEVVEVEELEELGEEHQGDLVVEFGPAVVVVLQHVGHIHGDLAEIGFCGRFYRGGDERGGCEDCEEPF